MVLQAFTGDPCSTLSLQNASRHENKGRVELFFVTAPKSWRLPIPSESQRHNVKQFLEVTWKWMAQPVCRTSGAVLADARHLVLEACDRSARLGGARMGRMVLGATRSDGTPTFEQTNAWFEDVGRSELQPELRPPFLFK